MKKTFFFFFFIIFLMSPMASQAIGQMTQPINITDALRGAQIHQEIIAVNGEAKPISVIFTGSGQIKDWVKFYNPKDLNNAVATTTIESKANLNMIAVFSVPADAANGEYTGAVSVTSVPDEAAKTDESSASLSQKIDREVTIMVSDTENISLEASVIPKTYDLSPKESLSVRIIYDNQSNVSLTPSIDFKIKNGDKTAYNVIYPYPESEPAVNPRAMQEIPVLEIPTLTLENGKYRAELQFKRGDKVILEKQFGFSLGAQKLVLGAKIINSMKGNGTLLIGLIALILLAITVILVKKNINLKKIQGRV